MEIFKKSKAEICDENEAELAAEIEAERDDIPSNGEIIKMIPSKAVREYLIKIGWQFSERDRFLLRRYLAAKNDDEFESLFKHGRYVSVPHPFRRGDIVAAYGFAGIYEPRKHEGRYELGIMRGPDSDEDWADWDKRVHEKLMHIVDFSDVCTTVEFLQNDGSFSHEHPNPMELEFAFDVENALPDDTPKTTYLKVASELMAGKGSIELLQMYRHEYTESVEHLVELLESIDQELHEYMEDFNDYRKLYLPDNLSVIRKLSAADKIKAGQYLGYMECDVRRICNDTEDLAVPANVLKKQFSNDEDGKKRSEAKQKLGEAKHLFDDILSLCKHSLLRINNFTKTDNAPKKQLWIGRIVMTVKKMGKLLSGVIDVGEMSLDFYDNKQIIEQIFDELRADGDNT